MPIEEVAGTAGELIEQEKVCFHGILPEGSFGDRYAAVMMPVWD